MKSFGIGERGQTTAILLVSLVLLGMVVHGGTKALQGIMKGQRAAEYRGELEQLRQILRSRVDCAATYDPANNPRVTSVIPLACNGKLKLFGRKTDGTVYPVTDANRRFGSWKLEGSCNADGSGFTVLATRPLNLAGTRFALDTGLNRPLDANHPRANLFAATNYLCPAPSTNGSGGGGTCTVRHPATIQKVACGIMAEVGCESDEYAATGGAWNTGNINLQSSHPATDAYNRPTGWRVVYYDSSPTVIACSINDIANGTTAPGSYPCFTARGSERCGTAMVVCCKKS